MIILTPRIYRKNIKQSLLSRNKIDTVNMHPISNLTADAAVFHTETINTVNLQGEQYTLPISNNVNPTHWRTVNNATWINIFAGDVELAKSRVDCVMVSGTTICKTNEVVQGTPVASITLKGTSSKISRGNSTYDDYPATENLNTPTWSLANWIYANSTESTENLEHDYSGGTFAMNPWVKNVISEDDEVDPTANDILTEWVSAAGTLEYVNAWWENWTEKSNFLSTAFSKFRMFSPNALSRDRDIQFGTRLQMYNMYLPIISDVRRLDDYNFEVSWTVPIRMSYLAASRGVLAIGTGFNDVDNYAFVDRVSEIIIELSGVPYSTAVHDITYSLDSRNELTEIPKDTYPIDIDAGEAFTLGTYYGSNDQNLWSKKLAKDLLIKYKDGKYVVTCDVAAEWAILNNIRINTQMQIKLLDGTMLKRKNSICTFEVKNIVKSYKNSDFVFTLSLLES